MLNAGVQPVVPSRGSVGASGDLAPLAHIALVLIGEGLATCGDDPSTLPGGEALARAGLQPATLAAKEGLALINQTLDEALAEQEGDFDADTRWALAWFEQSGFAEGEYATGKRARMVVP